MNTTGRTSRHASSLANRTQAETSYRPPYVNRAEPVLDLIGKGNRPKPQPCKMPDIIPISKSTLAERLSRMSHSTPKTAAKIGAIYMQNHTRRAV